VSQSVKYNVCKFYKFKYDYYALNIFEVFKYFSKIHQYVATVNSCC